MNEASAADTGINADTGLYTKRDIKRVNRTLRKFIGYAAPGMIIEPWLDVGAGESYMRGRLEEKLKINFHISEIDLDFEKYEYADGFFKTITSFEVLEHLFNPLNHLIELRRILAGDGNLFLTTPNDYSLIYKVEHLTNRKYHPHFHQFSERDLKNIMKRAGFKIVSLRKYFASASGTIARISRNDFLLHAVKIQDQ